MATIENKNSEGQSATGVQLGIGEALLRSEIEFWHDLIESSKEKKPSESIERMRFAMALAESRLASLLRTDRKDGAKVVSRTNVYLLDEARGMPK